MPSSLPSLRSSGTGGAGNQKVVKKSRNQYHHTNLFTQISLPKNDTVAS